MVLSIIALILALPGATLATIQIVDYFRKR